MELVQDCGLRVESTVHFVAIALHISLPNVALTALLVIARAMVLEASIALAVSTAHDVFYRMPGGNVWVWGRIFRAAKSRVLPAPYSQSGPHGMAKFPPSRQNPPASPQIVRRGVGVGSWVMRK